VIVPFGPLASSRPPVQEAPLPQARADYLGGNRITEKRGRMETDWQLIRDVLNAAIDSEEKVRKQIKWESH
jgi:hypothetical protein